MNNAGILRDRMIFSMTEAEWDDIVGVHLKGHFCPTRHAAAYWRGAVQGRRAVDARIINTASPSGLYGNTGQTNYGAAKAGIAGFTLVCALELGRLGVTANCLAPDRDDPARGAAHGRRRQHHRRDPRGHRRPAGSPPWPRGWPARCSKDVTGRVFDVRGETIAVAEGWHRGPDGTNPSAIPPGAGKVIQDLLARPAPNADLDGRDAPDRF